MASNANDRPGSPEVEATAVPTGSWYRFTNMFLGEDRSLDTYSNAGNEPFMGDTGNYSGQYWQFTPLSGGYFRLTNMFLGSGRSLDTYSDLGNEPFMGNTGNYSGQYWKITLITGTEEIDFSGVDATTLKPSVRRPKS